MGLNAEQLLRLGENNVLKIGGQVDQLFGSTDYTSYTRNDVQPGSHDEGNYSVIVSNNFGSVTSANAALIVTNTAPVITQQPLRRFCLRCLSGGH